MFSSVLVLLTLFPLLSRCAPARLQRLSLKRDEPFLLGVPVVTDYVTSTSTSTSTSTMTITSTSLADSSSLPTPTGPGVEESILFVPPTITVASPSLTSTLATPTATHTPPEAPIVAAYYPDWAPSSFPPTNIDFSRFDWIDFAFAVPDQNFNLTWADVEAAPGMLTSLVGAAHTAGKKVKLSVGGWSGSKYFSPAVATNSSRTTFVSNILAMYDAYDVDGIDIDWEYPGTSGNLGNIVSANDTANFLTFLQLLRESLPAPAYLTVTATDSPFADTEGNPMVDVSGFAEVVDWLLIMNYDVFGSSSTPGANAPLSDACHNSSQPTANAESAFTSWTSAGFPPSKLVLGVPSYGYISKSSAMNLLDRRRQRHNSTLDSQLFRRGGLNGTTNSTLLQIQNVQVTSSDGSTQVQFNELVSEGALLLLSDIGSSSTGDSAASGTTTYGGAGGFTRYWDACSSSPFLRSATAGQVITYDDPESLGMKAAFAKSAGMLGVNMFDVHGDTDSWDLIDAVRANLGII